MMMGKASRDKGGRFERELVNTARAHDLESYRVPLSGAAEGFKNDIIIKIGRTTWEIEAKKERPVLSFYMTTLKVLMCWWLVLTGESHLRSWTMKIS